jgi:hypothetical protein
MDVEKSGKGEKHMESLYSVLVGFPPDVACGMISF